MLTNSIDNPQYLDFILADTEREEVPGQQYSFERGYWQLSYLGDLHLVADTKDLPLSPIFLRNTGTTQVKLRGGEVVEVILMDGNYQDRLVRL